MIIKSEFFKKSGIYCIINFYNGKRYIGSSKNIWQRLQCHRSYLRKNKHANSHLQSAWLKYKEESFLCLVLEYCEINKLVEREQFYIDNLKPEYNSVLNVERPIVSQFSRNKLSLTRKRLFKEGKMVSNSSKEIHKYSLDGIYIETYPNIRYAAKINNMHQSTIHRFLNGQYKKGGNYLWSYTHEEHLPKYIKHKKKTYRFSVELRMYDSNELIKTFDNFDECATEFKTTRQCIITAIRQKSKFRKLYRLFKIPRIAGNS